MRPLHGFVSLPLLWSLLAAFAHAQRPELVVQTGHANTVTVVAFAPGGRLLASGSTDHTVKLWDTTTGTELRALKGHEGTVLSLAFTRDGETLASGCVDKTIRLWDAEQGRMLGALEGHEGGVVAVAFGADGRTLSSVSTDAIQAPEGLRYALTFKQWDYTTGRLLRSFAKPGVQVIASAISADGRTFATGGFDQTVTLWEVATGNKLRAFEGLGGTVAYVTFSADGRLVAGSGKEGHVWEVATGREVSALRDYHFAAFSPDGLRLAVVGEEWQIRLVTLATGEVTQKFQGPPLGVECLAFSPDGRRLASGDGDYAIRLRDTGTGRDAGTLSGHAGAVKAVAFSPDGRTLVTGHRLNVARRDTLRLWDVATGRQPRVLTGPALFPTGLALNGDGRTLMAGDVGSSVYVWDVATGQPVRTLKVGLTPDDIALSADGKTLACGGRSKTIKILDAETGAERRTLTGTLPTTYSLAMTRDARRLARSGPRPFIELWDVTSGVQTNTLAAHAAPAHVLAFSPDGRVLASGSSDRAVILWDAASGRELRRLAGHTGAVYTVAFSPDGRRLASGGEDRTIKLWDVTTGRELATLREHTDAVNSVAFSPDGRRLASGGTDTTVRLWALPDGRELASLLALDRVDWLVATPDGLFDGSPASWGQILWRFSPALYDLYPVEYFFNEFYYPDLLPDLFAGRTRPAARNIAQKDRRQPRVRLSLTEGVAPAGAVTARSLKLRVDVSDAPAGAQDVRLFRNGALVKAWRGDVLRGQMTVALTVEVPIGAGENQFTAYAFNRDNVKSADATLSLTGADSLKRKGTAHVLAIGVNEYANRQYNLRYAVADARAFAAEVRHQQEQLGRFDRTEVTMLLDRDATKQNILERLAALGAVAQPEDEVLVYFAGHGTAQQNQFYLLPHDLGYDGSPAGLDQAALRTILAHSISDRELELAFENIRGGQFIFIIDACNSGQALEAEEKRRGPMNSKGLAQLAYEKGMYVLTASQGFQLANETQRLGHGYLTYALVEEGLKTAVADTDPSNGELTVREWLDYTTRRVPLIHREENARTSPDVLAKRRGLQVQAGLGAVEDVQQPRVFYRRELEAQPLVVALTAPRD